MGKIATWSFLNSKFGTSGSPTNKCPRKSDIEATGKVKVSGSYSSNQLVQEADCASASFTLTIICYTDAYWAGVMITGNINGTRINDGSESDGKSWSQTFNGGTSAACKLMFSGRIKTSATASISVGKVKPGSFEETVTSTKTVGVNVSSM